MHSLILTTEIKNVINELIQSGEIGKPSDINTSQHASLTCEDFANTVISRLPIELRDSVEVIGIDNFIMHDEDGVIEGSKFNTEWIASKWPTVLPPRWFGWEGMNNLSNVACFNAGTHIWIYAEGVHYDSECCEGVINPLELPFLKRAIMDFAKMRPELVPLKTFESPGLEP